MTKIVISDRAYQIVKGGTRDWNDVGNVRLPDGSWECEVTPKVAEALQKDMRPGETYSDVVVRAMTQLWGSSLTDGGHRHR